MGTEKRQRQKQGRQARMAAAMTQAKRRQTRRRFIQVLVLAAVVLLGLFIFSLVSGDDDGDDVAVGDEEATDTTASSTTTTSLELSPVGEEVLEREPPDPEPPPEDLEAGALETETLIEGQGEGAAVGDTVTVHYIGKTADGNVFDQSWERGQTFPFPLGQGQVIAGWDQGLVGAKEGERLRLEIGADNAYGEQGNPPTIPPNAPLAFVVDVVDIAPAPEPTTTTTGSDSG